MEEPSMRTQHICIVTLHGIGFQRAPDDRRGITGYADGLHAHLRQYLNAATLGEDPQRPCGGPVYVQSDWPPDSRRTEEGLKRLGTWTSFHPRSIDATGMGLVRGDARLAHVALVYSHLEDQGPNVGSLMEATAKAALSHAHYASVFGIARMLLGDAWTMVEHRGGAPSSLQVRSDQRHAPKDPFGLLATLKQLEEDVTTYVCRNDLRERVRGFVREALLRLAYRSDVDGIIINSHSQGTVLAFDVLRELPPVAAEKVRGFLTMGSPLRKYVDLFAWGNEIGSLAMADPRTWMNFYDPEDPVADPLSPPASWHPRDDPVRFSGMGSMFAATDPDTGVVAPVVIEDRAVDNVAKSEGEGLRAHNYWDNEQDVIAPLAAWLMDLAGVVAQPAVTGAAVVG
jgi:hypothetical protein